MPEAPGHPYRSQSPFPPPSRVDFATLDAIAGAVRHDLLRGAFNATKRSDVARLAVALEVTHHEVSRAVAQSSVFTTALTAVMLALASLANRALDGRLGTLVPLGLIAMALVYAFSLVFIRSQEATLVRLKEAYGELQKFALTLPLDDTRTGVRVDTHDPAGATEPHGPVAVIESMLHGKQERR